MVREKPPSVKRIASLYAPGRDKPVAFVNVAQKLLYKTVDGRRHFLQTPPSISFDDAVLDQARNLGAAHIEVTDGSTSPPTLYTVDLATFLRYAETVNRGYGRQLALRFTFWCKNGAPSEAERLAESQAARAETAAMQQGALFIVEGRR